MTLSIDNMSRAAIENLPPLPHRTEETFTSVVIVPGNDTHDSGYNCMFFVLMRGENAIYRTCAVSDVIHLGGLRPFTSQTKWSIDCLPNSKLLRAFPTHNNSFRIGYYGSSLEVIDVEDE